MEPFENSAKNKGHTTMMAKNGPAGAAFKVMCEKYHVHLELYSKAGGGSGVQKTQQNLNEGRILKWKDFDSSYFDAYMDARNARLDLMQAYRATLAESDEMKNDQT
jgi:hypothetical protein